MKCCCGRKNPSLVDPLGSRNIRDPGAADGSPLSLRTMAAGAAGGSFEAAAAVVIGVAVAVAAVGHWQLPRAVPVFGESALLWARTGGGSVSDARVLFRAVDYWGDLPEATPLAEARGADDPTVSLLRAEALAD